MAANQPELRLFYFKMPGRAESIRSACALGNLTVKDDRMDSGAEWRKHKMITQWKTVPMLEVDGQQMGQCRAVLRYVGALGGLYPKDPLAAFKCDQILDVMEDLQSFMGSQTKNLPKEEADKLKEKRMDIYTGEGKGATLLADLEAFIAAHGKNGFAVGDSVTIADCMIHAYLSNMCSGFFDHLHGKKILPTYPHIAAVRQNTATLLAKYHESMKETYEALKLTKMMEAYMPFKKD